MPGFPDRISKFWKELKNRRVLRSTTVYVALVFGLLELIDIISGPLNLPAWVLKVIIFLFIIGFPTTILVSWFFSFSPEGIRRHKKPYDETFLDTSKDVSIDEMSDIGSTITDDLIPELPRTGKSNGKIYGFSSLILICLAAILFLFYGGKLAAFNERDWVVLADFVNHTDEEIFDHSLNTAFEISIMQSRHINVISRRRIQEVLKRIGNETETVIDEVLCREIAMREGATVYIVPEISRVGKQYILTAKLMEAENSEVLASEIIYSNSKGEILKKLDRMTRKMRQHLGESRYKISGQNRPLEQATTSSLDALKQYSLGIESHIKMDFKGALSHYENAIRLDSNFTAAKASFGNILYDQFDNENGKVWLDEAIKSLDDLTERERLGIMAFYAANVEKDLDKSIKYSRVLIELYPDYPMMRNNLAWYLQNRGFYEESVREYKEVIRLDPSLMIPYAGLIANYLRYLGQIDSALFWSNRMISADPDNGWGYFYRGSCDFALGDYENAETVFEKANNLAPGSIFIQYRLSHTYRILGKYDKAVKVLNEIIQTNNRESSAYYELGVCYGMMDLEDKARESYLQYKSFIEYGEKTNPDDPTILLSKGIVLTRLGEKEEGLKAGMKGFEMDTSNHFNFARFMAVQGKTVEALDHLEIFLEQGHRNIVWIKMEPDMFMLWDSPRYKQLLNNYFY